MRIAITAARIIVGLLFIFSGLVKANDPLGLSYKMQEFFELWGIAQFNDWTLALSVLIIAFEIIAGALSSRKESLAFVGKMGLARLTCWMPYTISALPGVISQGWTG